MLISYICQSLLRTPPRRLIAVTWRAAMICFSSAFLNFFQCKCFPKLLEQLRTAPLLLTYFVKSHVKDLNSVHLCSGPIYKYLILNIIFQIKCGQGADERSRCFSTEVLPLNQSNVFFPAPDSQSGEKFPSILQLCPPGGAWPTV